MSNSVAEVPAVSGMSHRKAELVAAQILTEYDSSYLTTPKPLPVAHLWEFWLPKRYKRLRCRVADLPGGLEGLTRPTGEILLASDTYEALLDDDGRARFTALHECVHGIIHVPQTSQMSCESYGSVEGPTLYRRNDLPAYLDPEWQAHRVAGAILMPAEAMKNLSAEAGILTPELVMSAFHTSRAAAITRVSQLQELAMLPPEKTIPSGRSRRS